MFFFLCACATNKSTVTFLQHFSGTHVRPCVQVATPLTLSRSPELSKLKTSSFYANIPKGFHRGRAVRRADNGAESKQRQGHRFESRSIGFIHKWLGGRMYSPRVVNRVCGQTWQGITLQQGCGPSGRWTETEPNGFCFGMLFKTCGTCAMCNFFILKQPL